MRTLLSIELYKIFRKWRTYIGFLALGVIVPVILAAFYKEGDHYLDFMTQGMRSMFIFEGNLMNGYLVSYILLSSLVVHIPFLITLVTGDLLAGEATAGTYRLLLIRPISRLKIVTAKYVAGLIYTGLLILWLAVLSLGLGLILLGPGELLIIKKDITIIAREDVLWRFLLAYSFAALSMSTVASLAFLFSSMVENAIGPIISTMAVIIIFIILSSIDIGFFKDIKPYLFTNYMSDWRLFFDSPADLAGAAKSAAVLLGHSLGFFGLTIYLFRRKDILS
jgi:ABC-2 type transport system permease protein